MKLKKIILLLVLILPAIIFGQGEASNWYFGENAGLRFNDDGTVVALTDGQLNTYEGCASISSPDGNLLFYTDGQTIYDRNHNAMPSADGTADNPNPYTPLSSLNGLYGGESSTQSAIIVPWPENPNLYFVFTTRTKVPEISGPGLNYSVVDMNLNGGFGDVTTKNVNLLPNCAEKITAVVKDCRSESFWVVALGTDGSPGTRPFNTYHAFEISTTGVNVNSVESNSPNLNISRNGVGGYLKFSPDGTKLASANMTEGLFIYNFDTDTGIISDERRLFMSGSDLFAYGIEFSPSSRYLYTTSNNDTARTSTLFQFDTQAISISNSRIIVDRSRNFTRGALQLGPNGKIYRSLPETYLGGGPFLGVINNPDQEGTLANYQHNAVALDGRFGFQGLPPFVQSFFNAVDLIPDDIGRVVTDYQVCEGQPLVLETQYILGATYEWRNGSGDIVTDGDADEHIHNISEATLADAGDYRVTIMKPNAQACPISGTLEVIVRPLPQTTSEVLFLCDSDADTNDGITTLDLTQLEDSNFNYTYFENIADRDADNNPIQDPTNYTNTSSSETIYYNAASVSTGCSNSAELQLEIGNIAPFTLDPSYFICSDNPTVTINGPAGYDSYQWIRVSNGQVISTAVDIDISDTGDYRLETNMNYNIGGTNYSCSTDATFNVIQSSLSSASLIPNGVTPVAGVPFTICQNQNLMLEATAIPGGIYQWTKDGVALSNTGNTYQIAATAVTDAGAYEVTVTDPAAASCPVTATLTLAVDATITNSVVTMQTCDTDMDNPNDGITNIDLTAIEDSAFTYIYFETVADRTANVAIPDPTNYRNASFANNPTVYFSTTNSLGCEDFGELQITVNTVSPLTLDTNYWLCPENPSVTISAPNGYDSYQWFQTVAGTPQLVSSNQDFTTNEVGEYVLEVSTNFTIPTEMISCSSSITLNVLASSLSSVDLTPNGTPVANDFTICEGEPLILETQEIPGALYVWEKENLPINNPDGYILQIDASTVLDAGNYSVTVTPADASSCPITGTLDILVEPVLIIADAAIITCDSDADNRTDGVTTVDLTQIENQDGTFSFSYHESIADRDGNIAITSPENYRNTVPFNQTLFVKVINTLGCESLTELQIEVNNAPEILLEDNYWLCSVNPTLSITGPDGFNDYQWFRLNGNSEELISSEQDVAISETGEYMLEVGLDFSNENETVRCSNIFVFGVLPSIAPSISDVRVEGENNSNTVEVVIGEEGDFEFSIDGVLFQDSNVFENVPPGSTTVYAQDRNGCGIVEETIEIEVDETFGFPKFFTPNGDGINDFWQYIPPPPELDIAEIDIEMISIFNRYGNLIIQIDPNARGWNGRFLGKLQPSSDYWFKANIAGNAEIRGHFTLKR